jgi:hypothetical protein
MYDLIKNKYSMLYVCALPLRIEQILLLKTINLKVYFFKCHTHTNTYIVTVLTPE